jgi:hypothetical protein
MSTEPAVPEPPCRSLAGYVDELVTALGEADASAVARMRSVVGTRRARIRLDDEAIHVAFGPAGLVVEEVADGPVDGEGATDRATVLDLLDGHVEVTDAILDGRLEVRGNVDGVVRMFLAIEILLDGSTRAPALQALARDFRADPCREPRRPPVRATRRKPWYPAGSDAEEHALLGRLGLLPEDAGGGRDRPA